MHAMPDGGIVRGLTPRDAANFETADGVVHAIRWITHQDDYHVTLACLVQVLVQARRLDPNPSLVDPEARPVDCLGCLVATIIR